ncbi:thiol reductant ABC exporter subunit CydC [Allonocardiopsis opalescens]|uniref:ATP-binding cassette subfamily C protein/ATP-binding cassette subfamily C protein CydC n=1 Tax=Allonocardiopsis opalescens TaxID=1144618 RepID=A0A2T0QDR7_9ACTN|nr:thiol reductant ABC exporter subunit CydC [Allonocardiopsis opalescens]PRY02011.1 ATP-binding cassette subfamily C protein/ATP-binding cassette subfamily C protein CydC [Allonocardiopsis opalescens]
MTEPTPGTAAEDGAAAGPAGTARTLREVTRGHGGRLALAALAAASAELAGLGLTATAAWLIATAAEQRLIGALGLAIVGVRAFALARGVLRYLERLTGHDVALRALADLRGRVYDALVPRGVRRWRRDDLLNRMSTDVDAVQDLLLRSWLPVAVAGAAGAAAVAVTAFLHPPAALLLAAGLLLAGAVLPPLAAARSAAAAASVARVRAELAVHTGDVLEGAAELAVYGAHDRFAARVAGAGDRLAAAQRRAAGAEALAGAGQILVQGATVLAVALAGIAAVDVIGGVAVVVLGLTALAVFEPLRPLPAALVQLRASRAALRRVVAVLGSAPGEAAAAPGDGGTADPAAVDLRLDDVTVRLDPSRPPALRGVRLDVPAGRRVAVVGPSGAGKSTLIAAVLGEVAPESGTVLLAGRPPAGRPDAELRRLVSGVTQDPHVFQVSLAENLRLARPGATAEQLREAARAAGLLADIDAMPEGFETLPGQDGAQLSGGQRQRLALARALLADPPVLVLDEPTEGLDDELADAVLGDVLAATADRTTLLVTHRLTGLEAVDEIVVLEDGRITQRGGHAELAARPGYFRERLTAEQLARAPLAAAGAD